MSASSCVIGIDFGTDSVRSVVVDASTGSGVAQKSRFVMQTIADVLNMEVTVPEGDQPVALGAAMFAATAAGLYRSIGEAQRAMSSGIASVYRPDPDRASRYDRLYARYLSLGSFIESEIRSKS